MIWPILLVTLGIGALLAYWELILAEGAHLGPRVVVWTYDLAAARYDRIKKFDLPTEADLIGLPLTAALAEVPAPRVLDVAAGTGRTARALLPQVAFDGAVVSLDLSARMIRVGREQCAAWPGRVDWVHAPADPLPFADGSFNALTCPEAPQFFPLARAAVG